MTTLKNDNSDQSVSMNTIYNMDCIEGMKLIPDGSIDLTVTSPPYDNLRTYDNDIDKTRGEHIWKPILQELYRVTKEGGVVVWVVGDATIKGSETLTSSKQKIYAREECGFNIHDTMIYQKSNYMPLTHNRYEQEFEYMFIFSKGKPNTFNPIMKPNKYAGNVNGGTFRQKGKELMKKHSNKPVKEFGIKGNIFNYLVGSGKTTSDKEAHKHPAIFPEKLAEDHILSWSDEGDIVLDPFMGSGTTAKMAKLNNRNFIGFEISKEYVDIANKRIQDRLSEK